MLHENKTKQQQSDIMDCTSTVQYTVDKQCKHGCFHYLIVLHVEDHRI